MGLGRLLRVLLGNSLLLRAYCLLLRVMTDSLLKERLQSFIESEARSCSMDFGCITPEYVYRMWGGSVAIDEIATGLTELRKNGYTLCGTTDSRN
jgi:hypothetical protein